MANEIGFFTMSPICPVSNELFVVSDRELDLLDRLSPVIAGTKFPLPPPGVAPWVRMRALMAWRNERALYVRTCDRTGRKMVSMYHPDVEFPVYHGTAWWSEENDATAFGREFDFAQPAFEQFAELQRVVPRMHMFTYALDRLVNSDYTNCSGDLKDCYMTFCAGRSELCFYCSDIIDTFGCVDCLFVHKSNSCYECVDIENCYGLTHSQSCKQCNNSAFLFDCRGCSDCLACVGLRQKRFHILNEEYSEVEYKQQKAEIAAGGREAFEALTAHFEALLLETPRKACQGDHNEDCTGDYISHSKQCRLCFYTTNAEDCINCTWFDRGKDCLDFYAWGESELCYQAAGAGDNAYRTHFVALSSGMRDSLYIDACNYSKNCLLCAGLKNKEHCILNRQYSKAQYEELAPRIVRHMMETGEWGLFFPSALSSFGYNETAAQEYFPLTKQEAQALGFRWCDYEAPLPSVGALLDPEALPYNIREVGDDVLKGALRCTESGKPFRITRQELDFYRNNNLPLPSMEPTVRHRRRVARRNKLFLFERPCASCSTTIVSSYEPHRQEAVFCESCYLSSRY